MPCYLGIDTSNYTTSVALYDTEKGMRQIKKLLPVREGECGLRQSDTVFHHTRQLPELMEKLLGCGENKISAIGVSSRPRDAEGSYMPCFTVGHGTARSLSAFCGVPLYTFSHQSGHIAAAVYSADCLELFDDRFIAFHVSGGTTEAVLVTPGDETEFKVSIAARTLDLNAGQLIDRIGVMMGLQFPCGAELEELAKNNDKRITPRATLKGSDCCLSGIENICRKVYEDGASKEETAALCLACVEKTLSGMCRSLLNKYGDMPVLFAGGVMSDRIIRSSLEKKFGALFAAPEYSADNAAGIAWLCGRAHNKYNAPVRV